MTTMLIDNADSHAYR